MASLITSVRQAAAMRNVSPPVIRRWLSLGLLTEPPWTRQQLHRDRSRALPTWPSGAPRHLDPLAGGLRLRPMPRGAKRRREGPLSAQGARATPGRRAATALGCDLRRPGVPDGAPRTRSDIQPGMGARQDRPGMVKEAG